MKLTPRLQSVSQYVKANSIVADIGTDHGYVPVFLVQEGISQKVIATDVNRGPLLNARSYIEEKGLSDKIETRLGDGIKVLNPGEVDTVIIAGMGGQLIKDILKASKKITDEISSFILQPMTTSIDLRKFLLENNYRITDERLAKEGTKIYEIIRAEHGVDSIEDAIYFEIGKKLIENKDTHLLEFISKKISEIEQIIKHLKDTSTDKGMKRYHELKIKHEKYMEVMRDL